MYFEYFFVANLTDLYNKILFVHNRKIFNVNSTKSNDELSASINQKVISIITVLLYWVVAQFLLRTECINE